MTGEVTDTARDLVRHARFLITTAARAPSVHNTRPWRFQVSPGAVELWCDPGRTGVLPHAIGTSAGASASSGGWPARYPLHRSPSAGPGSGMTASTYSRISWIRTFVGSPVREGAYGERNRSLYVRFR